MNPRILIVDDEFSIRQMLMFSLQKAFMDVSLAADGASALQILDTRAHDLVLLDWIMPEPDGLQLTRQLRNDQRFGKLPIIMISARGGSGDRALGLDSGVDDFLVKPFSTRELIARVRAILRRAPPRSADRSVQVGGLVLQADQHRVLADENIVALGPTEFRLLELMMASTDRAWCREEIRQRLWQNDRSVEKRTVDVHIRRLRKALAPHGYDRFVQTVRGHGYRFSDMV